jgi:hypothetical protein
MEMLNIDACAHGYRHAMQVAGTMCIVETNYRQLESSLRDWTLPAVGSDDAGGLSIQIFVSAGQEAPQHAHFRGLHHLVVASFGHANIFVFDLLRRRVVARVSEKVARDLNFWNQLILPITIGVLGPTVGVVPVHCAGLSRDGEGLLVAGVSGAGKSTLAAALVQSGFDYVSDDWTYLSKREDRLVAHGTSARMKLLPDAVLYFPELAERPVTASLDGELAYLVEGSFFGGRLVRSCVPRSCFFLERSSSFESTFAPMSAEEALHRFRSSIERLPSQLPETESTRAKVIERIADVPCWTFCYGGTPQFAAREILSFVSCQRQEVKA